MVVESVLLKDEVYQIIGAAIEVHRFLGHGYAEAVYQEALAIELSDHGVPYVEQMGLRVFYKGHELQRHFVADFVCFDSVVVEIKAIKQLTDADIAQILNYLKTTGCRVGVLINFGAIGRLEWKRFVL